MMRMEPASKICSVCGSGISKANLPAHLQSCIRNRVKPKILPDPAMIVKLYAPCSNCHQQILRDYLPNHVMSCRPSKRQVADIMTMSTKSTGKILQKPQAIKNNENERPVQTQFAQPQLIKPTTMPQNHLINNSGKSFMDTAYESNKALDVDQQILPAVVRGAPINFDKVASGAADIVETFPCPHCQRNFSNESLNRHAKICSKAGKVKRKKFDVAATRIKGTDMEGYLKNGTAKSLQQKSELRPAKKSNWRHAHEAFMRIVRNARQGGSTGGSSKKSSSNSLQESSSSVSSTSSRNTKQKQVPLSRKESHAQRKPQHQDDDDDFIENPDYITCPCCSRRFHPQTAERHIPHCKSMKEKERLRQIQMAKFEELNKKTDALKRRTAYKPKTPIKKGTE